MKELWSTYYAPDKNGLFTKFDGDRMLSTYLRGDGDFRSDECVELLKKCDVVLTNGPFSLNTSLLFLALEHKKDFLLLGTQNLITSRAVFESFMKGEFWLGYTSGTFKFLIPKDYNLGKITQDNEGNRYAHLGNIAWYTNLKVEKEYKILELTQWYHPSLHQTFNNSNIINVDKVSDIPRDYDGIMGVPISYLTRHNPQQFKILGLINSEKWIGIKCLARIGTRMVYNRVLIQRNDTQSINPVFECKNIKYY